MHSNRTTEFLLASGIAAASALLGLLGGMLPQALLLGLAGYAAWHLHRIARLPDIIRRQRRAGPGHRIGLWSDVMAALAEQETRSDEQAQRLSQRLKLLHDTVTALPDAVAILRSDGTLEWSNPAAQTLLGIDTRDGAGHTPARLARDPILDEYLSAGAYARPLTLSAPGDRSRTLLLQVLALEDADSRRVIVARDISGQYNLDISHRDFIANISHELRTPLTVITGLLEHLEQDITGNQSAQKTTRVLQDQATRMRDLIADLLKLAQLESPTGDAQQEIVPVPDLLATILDEARALAAESGHVLIPDIQPGCGLRGNPGELRTAFINLVVNAVRHTPNRSEIRVTWSADASGTRFSVSDTGAGIPARHIPRLTERFYRIDPARSRDTGGTGLGLPIVREVLDHHDARLEINSTVGRGSTFTCIFPAERAVPLARQP